MNSGSKIHIFPHIAPLFPIFFYFRSVFIILVCSWLLAFKDDIVINYPQIHIKKNIFSEKTIILEKVVLFLQLFIDGVEGK